MSCVVQMSASSMLCAAAAPPQVYLARQSFVKIAKFSSAWFGAELPNRAVKLSLSMPSGYKQKCTTVCLFGGGQGKSENGSEASPWKSIQNAMGNLKKEPSIEDVLRQQMVKQEYFDGGSGGDRPGGGGGGDGSGESEDEGISGMVDEFVQVILATFGFIFLYMYIIDGEDITALAKDFIKFLFGGGKSVRLRRTFEDWGTFFQQMTETKTEEPYWLEKAIINTPTWYDSPAKYRRILNDYMEARYNAR